MNIYDVLHDLVDHAPWHVAETEKPAAYHKIIDEAETAGKQAEAPKRKERR
jgi:hypothetical protein